MVGGFGRGAGGGEEKMRVLGWVRSLGFMLGVFYGREGVNYLMDGHPAILVSRLVE